MTIKVSKIKLKASLILFIFVLAVVAVMVCIFVVNSIDYEKTKNFIGWFMPVSVFMYLILISVSLLLNISYRKSCIYAGAGSTALYVFQWIFYAPLLIFGVIILVIAFFCGASIPIFGDKKEKVIKIKDEKGNLYKLTPTYADRFYGGDEYEDQNGDLWETFDNGQTFKMTKRISPIYIDDESGNKLRLTPTFRGSFRYLDENGDEWWTLDGGQTVERIPKK